MRAATKTLTLALLLTVVSDAFGQQADFVQPRHQTNSLWNPSNPKRDWVDYDGRSGREREAGTVQQWVATPIRGPLFPNLQPIGRTDVIVNPFAK